MKTNKPRNRESRTKPIPTESSVAIRLRLPRESYDQMRDLVKNRRATKEDIFLRGLQAYAISNSSLRLSPAESGWNTLDEVKENEENRILYRRSSGRHHALWRLRGLCGRRRC